MESAIGVLVPGLARLGLAIHATPGAHDALDMNGGDRAGLTRRLEGESMTVVEIVNNGDPDGHDELQRPGRCQGGVQSCLCRRQQKRRAHPVAPPGRGGARAADAASPRHRPAPQAARIRPGRQRTSSSECPEEESPVTGEVVIDASLILKWAFRAPPDEPDTGRALDVLSAVRDGAIQ